MHSISYLMSDRKRSVSVETFFENKTPFKLMTPCGTSHLFILIGYSLEYTIGPLNVKQDIGETANSILE